MLASRVALGIADTSGSFIPMVPEHALHHVFRCHLQIRVTPDNTVSYNTSKTYNSVKESREAAARLALADGIVHRLKMENSLTSKIHKQLGLPVPTDLDAHDTVDEENTAGSLTQLVQQVTRNTAALQCEYTKAPGGSGKDEGARLHRRNVFLLRWRSALFLRRAIWSQTQHHNQAWKHPALRDRPDPPYQARCQRGGL